MEIDRIKVRIKQWEHEFIKKNQRGPSKVDIDGLPELKKLYKQYSSLKRHGGAKKFEKESAPAVAEIVEFGPTPQVHGKTISIFDMKLSPIKSSRGENENLTTVTPSNKETEADFLKHISPGGVKRQLNFELTPKSTLKVPEKSTKNYGPNSPLNLADQNLQIRLMNTPLKNLQFKKGTSVEVSFSPSPLIKKPLARSVYELEQERLAILEELGKTQDGIEQDIENENNGLVTSQELTNIFDDTTEQNVKTKHRKIIRRLNNTEKLLAPAINIQEELIKLKKKQVNEFLGEETFSDVESSSTLTNEDDDADKQAQRKKTRPKKYNLVSNNFRRLKLPKKNRGNGRRGHGRR